MKTLLFYFIALVAVAKGQYGPFEQSFGYIDVREGAHMFYWLFYTTAPVSNYTERPLVIWLQGGPGGSSTGIGNFEIMGPLNLTLQDRDYSWVKNFNVLYIDNPVGTGFSYVDNYSYLTTTNEQIAEDMLNLLRGFYEKHEEFAGVPLYMYGQSYGGKMVTDMALKINEAEKAGTIPSNLRGIAMGNSWISPVDSTLTWGPLLLAAGLVEQSGYENIQVAARTTETLFNQGQYVASTTAWSRTQSAVFAAAGSVDFYDITTKMPLNVPDTRNDLERSRDMLIRNRPMFYSPRQEEIDLDIFMDAEVKPALNIPAHVFWGSQRNAVFGYLREDFMKPVIESKRSRDMLIRYKPFSYSARQDEIDLDVFMDAEVKPALNIPANVFWGSQSNAVFSYLSEDFMKPAVESIERLLNETDIIVTKYNGNLDLICDTPGQLLWLERMRWPGKEGFQNAPRLPIWENDKLEGYYKSYGNFRFFWINSAGHSVPRDNPAGTNAFLRDMTGFPLL